MKHKKWPLIVLAIIVVFNILYFYIKDYVRYDEVLCRKAETYLATTLDAKVDIKSISIGDNSVQVSGIKVNNADYSLYIPHINIGYSIIEIIKKQSIKLKYINLHRPELDYRIKPRKTNNTDLKLEIPILGKYFDSVEIIRGTVSVEYQKNKLKIRESLNNINAKIINDAQNSQLTLSTKTEKSGDINLSLKLKKGRLNGFNLDIKNYQPALIYHKKTGNIHTKINLKAVMQHDNITYFGNIAGTHIQIGSHHVDIDKLIISGTQQHATLNCLTANIDDFPLDFTLQIDDPFYSDGQLSGDLNYHNVQLHRFTRYLDGIGQAQGEFYGTLKDMRARATATVDTLDVSGLLFTQVIAHGEIKDFTFLDLRVENAVWENSNFYGSGTYEIEEDLLALAACDSLAINFENFEIKGKLAGGINFVDKKFSSEVKLHKLNICAPGVVATTLSGKAFLDDYGVSVKLSNPPENIQINGTSNYQDINAELLVKRLKIRDVVLSDYNEPTTLSGNVRLTKSKDTFVTRSRMRLYDNKFGHLDGIYHFSLVADLVNKRSYVSLKSKDAKINYNKFNIDMLAQGTLDSLSTHHFNINDNIRASAWLTRGEELNYGFAVAGKNLRIADYLSYAIKNIKPVYISGQMDVNASYDSRNKGNVKLKTRLKHLSFLGINNLNAELVCSGNNHEFFADSLRIYQAKNLLATGKLHSNYAFSNYQSKLKIDSLQIKNILGDEYAGVFNADLAIKKSAEKINVQLATTATQIKIKSLVIDSLHAHIEQSSNFLTINKLIARSAKNGQLEVAGRLGYSFLSGISTNTPDTLSINYQGNLLNILAAAYPEVIEGNGISTMQMSIGTRDDELYIKQGEFVMTDGKVSLASQSEAIEKIRLKWQIKNNLFSIKHFNLQIRGGKLYIKNKHNMNDDDIKLGMLNFGSFQFKTGRKRIMLHMPSYMPAGAVVDAYIKGIDEEYGQLKGPIDELSLALEVFVENGQAIYPPDTQNILEIFSDYARVNKKKHYKDTEALPLSMQMRLKIGKNIRYVTYPADLNVAAGSYLNLVYKDGEWLVNSADFSSNSGTLEMFGADFIAKSFQILITPYQANPAIEGLFEKKSGDGSQISLHIYPVKSGASEKESLQFKLSSDNPDDTTDAHIIARLSYNRSLDELSPSEQQDFLQNEAIHIAGISIGNAIVDPFLSPIENRIRRIMHFDTFRIRPGWVQNILYYYTDSPQTDNLQKKRSSSITLSRLSYNILLDKLTIEAGKYALPNAYFAYQLYFEKSLDLAIKSNDKLELYHTIGVRYDLPWRLKMGYDYHLDPDNNSHEWYLERDFRF